MTEPTKPSSLFKPIDWSTIDINDDMISAHGRARMAERGITLDMVKQCLLNGYCCQDIDDSYIYCLPTDFDELRVVISRDRFVVTAMYAPMIIDKLN
jgi:hypothetical protein